MALDYRFKSRLNDRDAEIADFVAPMASGQAQMILDSPG